MKKFNTLIVVLILVMGITAFSPVRSHNPIIVEGYILSAVGDRPIHQAHVFIIHGEEEALTDNKGYFRIESWQKLPLRVTVQYKNHSPTTIVISDASKKQTIRLKSRS